MVVEDNPVNQRVAARILEKAGFVVDVAGNGGDALIAVAAASYSAILMDCQMPEMDGFEATMELRLREEPGQHTPIIAMTAGAMADDRDKCLAAGMDDYISKPVNAQELRSLVARWVGGVPSDEPRRDQPQPAPRGRLNEATLVGLRELGAEHLCSLITLFIEDGGERTVRLRRVLEQGDRVELRKTAHSLKGSALSFGASELAALCARLESQAGVAADARFEAMLVTAVEVEFAQVCHELRERSDLGAALTQLTGT